jgi:hypothetical protein
MTSKMPKIGSLIILLSAFTANANGVAAEKSFPTGTTPSVKSAESNLLGCWSTKTKRQGQPYSATYCLESGGQLSGSFTEGGDGTDFIGNWSIRNEGILEIILEDDPAIFCKYNVNAGDRIIYLTECTEYLLNGRYEKSEL